jgi:hypothetical protein
MLSGVLLSARAGWRLTEPGYAEVDDAGSVGACSAPPRSDSRGRARLPLSVQGTWTVLVPHPLAISPLHEVSGRLLLVVDTASDDQIRRQLISSAERDAPAAVEQSRQLAKAAAPTSESEPPASPAPTGNGSPYPAFGQPAAGGWGAPEPNGWGGAAPAGWPGQGGGSPAPAPGDWGSAPPGGPGPGPTPAPGQPRGSDGW